MYFSILQSEFWSFSSLLACSFFFFLRLCSLPRLRHSQSFVAHSKGILWKAKRTFVWEANDYGNLRIKASYGYLDSPSMFNWIEPGTIATIRNRVRLDPLVSIISSLGSDSLHPCNHAQVNLYPLIPIPVLSNPASSNGAVVSRVKSRIPGTIVMVVHGGSGKHSLRDTAILHSQRNITWVWNMHIRIKEDNEKKEREKSKSSQEGIFTAGHQSSF